MKWLLQTSRPPTTSGNLYENTLLFVWLFTQVYWFTITRRFGKEHPASRSCSGVQFIHFTECSNTPEEVQREKNQTETSVKWINCDAEREPQSSFFKTEMTLTNTPAFDAVGCANISPLIDNLIDIFSLHFYNSHIRTQTHSATLHLFELIKCNYS